MVPDFTTSFTQQSDYLWLLPHSFGYVGKVGKISKIFLPLKMSAIHILIVAKGNPFLLLNNT